MSKLQVKPLFDELMGNTLFIFTLMERDFRNDL
eukprot:CAMPEP_0174945506 /NCGR_PEP_ID=MMETSP1355-20121228/81830_1 /TAXON_ID=464990 /ORGANISM="Hemiselmis tepida, Strain CCMP443" /LENGTH=32 /DNA_ID= /DNA_START= /DNA_END= /DNA_ORIENTATION=